MISGEDLDTVRAVSTRIARELLLDIAPEKARHCDVMVEEYTRTVPGSSSHAIDRRHGFVSLESYVLVDLPAALICALIVEVVKFYLQERLSKYHKKDPSARLEILAHKFTDEAVKSGLSEDQALELTSRFTDILRNKPSIMPP